MVLGNDLRGVNLPRLGQELLPDLVLRPHRSPGTPPFELELECDGGSVFLQTLLVFESGPAVHEEDEPPSTRLSHEHVPVHRAPHLIAVVVGAVLILRATTETR